MTDAELGKWLREVWPHLCEAPQWGDWKQGGTGLYDRVDIQDALTALLALLRDVAKLEPRCLGPLGARLRAVLGSST